MEFLEDEETKEFFAQLEKNSDKVNFEKKFYLNTFYRMKLMITSVMIIYQMILPNFLINWSWLNMITKMLKKVEVRKFKFNIWAQPI